MSRDLPYLLDILEAARLALSYVGGMQEEDFLTPDLLAPPEL
ncbi:MAG: hypothetical protein ACRDIB_06760 [Ardenticatenaceae bacterium]